MFKKSKSKVLVDYASEEDDMSWHYHHSYKDKDIEGEEAGEEREEVEEDEEGGSPVSKDAKVKKIKSKKEKKMLSSKDDEHFLLTGVKLADRRGSNKKLKDEEKEKEKRDKPEKSHCFWESVTMTMKQITPTKKPEKMEGWEPPQLRDLTETLPDNDDDDDDNDNAPTETRVSPVAPPESLGLPTELPSWAGQGLEEDSSRYANLSDSRDSPAVRWTALAKGKLAGISRRGRGIVSESQWEGFK